MRKNDIEQLLDMAKFGELLTDLEIDAVVNYILGLTDVDSIRLAFLACSAKYENVYRVHPRVQSHIWAIVEKNKAA